MKKSTTLIVVLVGSIALNIFLALDLACVIDAIKRNCDITEVPGDTVIINPCPPDSDRYTTPPSPGGGREITLAQATSLVSKAFTTGMPANRLKGGFISKKALDYIFNTNLRANGVQCFVTFDQVTHMYSLVVQPSSNPHYDISQPTGTNSGIFLMESLCPTQCEGCGGN